MDKTGITIIVDRLRQTYPNATYELHWETPLQLLIATVLAAQCTDERVNSVTPTLFAKYKIAVDFANADSTELANDIGTISFNRKKASAIQQICQTLVDEHNGDVPDTMDDLLQLPRVARKTANVVLNIAFQQASGIIVDSHVLRVSHRLGLSERKTTDPLERDLMALIPQDEWLTFGPALVLHGRYTCTAKKPNCEECILKDLCPKLGLDDNED